MITSGEIRFSATARCACGAGLAHPKDGSKTFWQCSESILGKTNRDVCNTRTFPFEHFEITAEDDESAKGRSTRTT